VEPGQDARTVLARRLAHSGLGELRLNAVFLLEGDDEGGATRSWPSHVGSCWRVLPGALHLRCINDARRRP
jgi:hypothetical protein